MTYNVIGGTLNPTQYLHVFIYFPQHISLETLSSQLILSIFLLIHISEASNLHLSTCVFCWLCRIAYFMLVENLT